MGWDHMRTSPQAPSHAVPVKMGITLGGFQTLDLGHPQLTLAEIGGDGNNVLTSPKQGASELKRAEPLGETPSFTLSAWVRVQPVSCHVQPVSCHVQLMSYHIQPCPTNVLP